MKKIILSIISLFTLSQLVVGQCKIENTFFQNGEVLTYDMYFKLGFTSTWGGELHLFVDEGEINGEGDYKLTFQTNTSGIANAIYPVNDTLSSYITKDIVPIAYIKNADEGGDYTQERVFYTYTDEGKVNIHTKRHRNGEFKFDKNLTSDECIYDLVSVIYYARTLDFSNMKKNDKVELNFISGEKMRKAEIHYKGTKKVKGNNKKHYNCFELIIDFAAGGSSKGKEMMKVFVSNDGNRIPIQIETSLKTVGAIQGVIKSYKGERNSME